MSILVIFPSAWCLKAWFRRFINSNRWNWANSWFIFWASSGGHFCIPTSVIYFLDSRLHRLFHRSMSQQLYILFNYQIINAVYSNFLVDDSSLSGFGANNKIADGLLSAVGLPTSFISLSQPPMMTFSSYWKICLVEQLIITHGRKLILTPTIPSAEPATVIGYANLHRFHLIIFEIPPLY